MESEPAAPMEPAAAAPAADDESLRLAKLLHMELNGRGSRRARQPAPIPAALVKAARRPKQRAPSTSAESGEDEDAGPAAAAAPDRKKRRKKGEASGSDAHDSDPQSSKQPAAEAAPGGGAAQRKGAAGRGRAPAPGRRHLAAAAEARRKAAAAAGGGKARPGSAIVDAGQQAKQAQRTHVKCFFVGVRWGALLPVSALRSREKLAAAVAAAFKDDGASVEAGAAHVVFVGANAATSEFAGSGGGDDDGWAAAAKKAVRVYVR